MRTIILTYLLLTLVACAVTEAGEKASVPSDAPAEPVTEAAVATNTSKTTSTIPPSPVKPTDSPLSPSPTALSETPSPTPVPLTKAAIASCPVSQPNVSQSPSEHFVSTIFGYQNADGTLFTVFWPGNKVIFSPNGPGQKFPDGSLGMKWPWSRTVPGEVIVDGRRLDAPAPPMPTVILRGPPDGYGETGFHPSGLIFPSEGCWEVTGRVGDATLTFVTLVVEVTFEPKRPAWMPEGLLIKDTDVTDLPKTIREIFGFPTVSENGVTWGDGELSIETTQGIRQNPISYPETARQPVTVNEQPAVCVQGTWDKQGQWQAGADAAALEWASEGFSYRISHTGLGLTCEDLLRIAGSPQTTFASGVLLSVWDEEEQPYQVRLVDPATGEPVSGYTPITLGPINPTAYALSAGGPTGIGFPPISDSVCPGSSRAKPE